MIRWKELIIVTILSFAAFILEIRVDKLNVHSWVTGWLIGALDMMAMYYFVQPD